MALGLIILCGVLALVYGGVTIGQVMAAPAGSARMQEISAAVAEGAQAYLKRQYFTIGVVGIIVFLGLGYLLSWDVAIGFAIGAILSGAAGFIGMNVSVRANVRTAQARERNRSAQGPRYRLPLGRGDRPSGSGPRAAWASLVYFVLFDAGPLGYAPVRSHGHHRRAGCVWVSALR